MVSNAVLLKCPDCRVWDPENQPSVMRTLRNEPDKYADRVFMYVDTGCKIYGVPVSVSMILCVPHGDQVIREQEQQK